MVLPKTAYNTWRVNALSGRIRQYLYVVRNLSRPREILNNRRGKRLFSYLYFKHL